MPDAGGPVDALANVAGIMDNFAPIHEVDDDFWDRVFRINVTVPTPATAAQLAASITFLLSDDGTNIKGAILASDGGWSAP